LDLPNLISCLVTIGFDKFFNSMLNYRSKIPFTIIVAAGFVAAAHLYAQEKIIKTDGTAQDVKIVNVTGSNVQIQVGNGVIGIPIATISQIIMAPPAEFGQAMTAYEGKDYAKAAGLAKTVVDKYKGLPIDWARQATAMLGDIYVEQNDLQKAEAAYLDFLKAYPGKGSLQTDVGLARIAFSKKDYSAAKQKLIPIKEQALKLKNVPSDVGAAYSKAFYLLGQIEESEGNFSDALQDYLRTVTLFYQDHIAVNAAQQKADVLRKDHNIAVP
jgi:tetratricopeptide (TPR) repeat protein